MGKYIDCVATVLLIVGGLNWGLVALFDFNLVTTIFANPLLAKIVYSLVALSAIYYAVNWKRVCKC